MASNVVQDIFEIDTEPLGHPQIVSSFLIKGSEATALIDPGFPTSIENVVHGIERVDVDPEKLDYIILTHSHYDHAGATGKLAQIAGGAKIIAHKRAEFYLKNSAKISGGARMVFGPELSDELGEPIDVPGDRIHPVADGQCIDLGNKRLRVYYTPGHSGDHISLFEQSSGTLFPGDLVCLHYPQLGHVLIPAGSPPLYDTGRIVKGLQRLSELNVKRILTPHFGEAHLEPSAFIARNIESVMEWRSNIEAMFTRGLEFPQVLEKLRAGIIEASGIPSVGEGFPPPSHRGEIGTIPLRMDGRPPAVDGFLPDVWLRVMLKTGLMGYMADILQYARDLRPFHERVDGAADTAAGAMP